MNSHISFKNMDSSETLKVFIEEKARALLKYFEGKTSITWVISLEKLNCIAHCHLVGNNMDYFGEGITEDFKASIDVALHKLETQIRKHKEKVTNHHSHGSHKPETE